MNWSILPILTAMVLGFVGFCLMVAAFVMVARQGGWRQAMQSRPEGRRSLPRRVMVAGAFLGIVCGVIVNVLFLIPGGIPWSDGPDWGTAVAALLPVLAAVWYFVLRRPQTAGRQ
jgi:hypothetical protein